MYSTLLDTLSPAFNLGCGTRSPQEQAMLFAEKMLQSHLAKHGLSFHDVKPVLDTMDSPEKIKDAVANPLEFLKSVAQSLGKHPGMAQRFVVAAVTESRRGAQRPGRRSCGIPELRSLLLQCRET